MIPDKFLRKKQKVLLKILQEISRGIHCIISEKFFKRCIKALSRENYWIFFEMVNLWRSV